MGNYYGNAADYARANNITGEFTPEQFKAFAEQRPMNSSGQSLTNTQSTQYMQPTNMYTQITPVAGGVVPVAGNIGAGGLASTVLNADQAAAIPGAVAGQAYTDAQLNGLGNAQAASTSTDPGWFGSQEGGSTFANTAAGVGSLMGAYAAWQGIGAAKDTLKFQKQQYADQKGAYDASQARKAGLAERFQSLGK